MISLFTLDYMNDKNIFPPSKPKLLMYIKNDRFLYLERGIVEKQNKGIGRIKFF